MEWHYLDNQKQQIGPIDEADIKGLVANGTMKKTTMVWNESLENWLPACDSSLRTFFLASRTPPPPPNSAPTKAPPHLPDPTVALGKDENGVLDDFTKAEYGKVHYAGDINFPTAKNSISGKIFIFVGGIAGFALGGMLSMAIGLHNLLVPMGGAMIGAFVGSGIHKAVSSGIKSKRK